MERRLGRGLSTLLPGGELGLAKTELEVTSITPNPFQPRRTFETSGLEELRDSIKAHGVLQPILVRRRGDKFELISGERRWRASRLAGLSTIPAVIRSDVGDEQMLELALVENLQRQDLDPLERARGLRELMKLLGLNQEQVADKVGLKRPTVSNLLRLLELPAQVQDGVARGRLSMGHARAILGIEGDASRIRVAAAVEEQGLSVREVEARVRREQRGVLTPAPRRGAESGDPQRPAWGAALEQRLREALGTRVSIRDGGNYRGQVVIEYFNRQDLDRILQTIAPQIGV